MELELSTKDDFGTPEIIVSHMHHVTIGVDVV